MKYLTCSEASALMGTTARRVQQMCKNGEIIGAIKKGRSWMVPAEVVLNKAENPASVKKIKPLPVGISDFKQATSDYYYVDKTLPDQLILEVFAGIIIGLFKKDT